MNKKLLIFGTGEIGQLAHFYFSNDTKWKVHGFICDDEFFTNDRLLNLPCIKSSELSKYSTDDYAIHVSLSYKKLNKVRQQKYEFIKNLGYEMPSYISSRATIWSKDIGKNCLILEDQTIQPNVKIGDNVMLWSGNHIGHGTIIENHVYLASHIVVSGHCRIGERTFIGVNSSIKDFTAIGKDCFIGMGVSITQDCKDGAVFLPAKPTILEADDPLAKRIKGKYFGV